jgi:hypothetical protein
MKKIMFLAIYLSLNCIITQIGSQELPYNIPDIEMRHRHRSSSSRSDSHKDHFRTCPTGATGAIGPTGDTGPTGATGVADFAWAFSLESGPSGGYPFVDTTSSNDFISLENQHPSSDIQFINLSTISSSSGTMVQFLNAGTYFVEFSIAASTTNGGTNIGQNYYLLGVFQGTGGNPPNTLPNDNLFIALTRKFDGAYTLTNFLVIDVDADDTLALGNAGTFLGPTFNLFLQQAAYTPSNGSATLSTTAGISIIRLK